MKNQYFGDINDYKKYGLIKLLSGYGKLSTVICWMLTPNGTKLDGRKTKYLHTPQKCRGFDPVIYDFLRKEVIERGTRRIESLEHSNILSNCKFYSEAVPDSSGPREEYLQRFLEYARGADLAFFDPDKGMEVKSVPYGRRNSSNYLYWAEARKFYSEGHSLLVYQHWPREPREAFSSNLRERFLDIPGVSHVHLYHTSDVVFLLVPQLSHEELFARMNKKIAKIWGNEIEVK